jgi:hypothetical protein
VKNKGNLMKINIGPYLNWWGPYQIVGLLSYLGFSKDTTHSWAEKSPEWFTNLCQGVHDKRKRKISVKIDKYDVWSMDSTLALIIVPMLKRIKEDKHGIPMTVFEEWDETDNTGNFTSAAMKVAEARWDLILDKMIWSFEQVIDEEHDAFWPVKPELDMKDYPEDEGKLTTPVRWSVEGKCNYDAMYAYHERIQEGLDLFATHYRNLWT